MIVSHKHKFIFLKTNKTAGTSMEIALAKFCGPDDIITPVSPGDEVLRSELGYRAPQKYRPGLAEYSRRDWLVTLRRFKRKRFFNHISARDVKLLVGDDIWKSYFKFCFERNPWDRVLSLYAWRCQTEPKPTISDFIGSRVLGDLTKRGIELYTIGGKIAVDRVCLYENLDVELEFLEQRLMLPEKLSLPRAKASHRVDKRHYREILDPHDRERIAKIFHREIAMCGYQF